MQKWLIIKTIILYHLSADKIGIFNQNRTAWKGPAEKWLDETREWMGSNFLDILVNYPLRFNNNPLTSPVQKKIMFSILMPRY
jgi:hypothetical protein